MMSGAELVLGVIGTIIAIFGAIETLCRACEDISGLPTAIRDIRERLPLIQYVLETAGTNVDRESHQEIYQRMNRVLEACAKKAESLNKILQAFIPSEQVRVSIRRRFTTAIIMTLRVDKVRRIKSLMKSISKDIQLLSESRIISDMGRRQIRANSRVVGDTEGLQSGGSMTPSQPERPSFGPSPGLSSGPSSGPSSGSISVNSTTISEQHMPYNQPRANHDGMEMLRRSASVNSAPVSHYQSLPRQQSSDPNGTGLETDIMSSDSDRSSSSKGRGHVRIVKKYYFSANFADGSNNTFNL